MRTRRGFLKRIISAGAGAGALVVGGAPALPQDSEELASVKLEIAKLELLKLQMEANPPALIFRDYLSRSTYPSDIDLMGKTVTFKRPRSLLEEVGKMHGQDRANNREAWLESAFQSLEEDA